MLCGSCDGHVILRTSSDAFLFNLRLHFEGPNCIWRALKTSTSNVDRQHLMKPMVVLSFRVNTTLEHFGFTKSQLLSLIRWFSIQILIVHDDIFIIKLLRCKICPTISMGFIQILTHHPWQYLWSRSWEAFIQKISMSDIKYHMTLTNYGN
jgi:hypothetical protein